MSSARFSTDAYLAELTAALQALDRGAVERIAAALVDAQCAGRMVFICGNGGSAAVATHWAADLSKLTAVPDAPAEHDADTASEAATDLSTTYIDDAELFDDVEPAEGSTNEPHANSYRLPSSTPADEAAELGENRWDESRLVGGAEPLHHDDLVPTSLDDHGPTDPNAVWLADLYSQFIDEPEANNGKKRRRGEPNPVDVAFKAAEQDGEAKVSTLKRLMGALKKL